MMPVDLVDEQLKLSLLLERYRPVTVSETTKALSEALDNIQLKILKTEDLTQRLRLKQLESTIINELNKAYAVMGQAIPKDVAEVSEVAFTQSMKALGTHGAEVIAFAAMPKRTISAIMDMNEITLLDGKGYRLSDFVDLQKDSHVKRFRQIVAAGIAEGAGTPTISRRLKEVNTTVTRRELQTIAHTVVAEASGRGSAAAYKQADDVIIGWESVGVLDGRTSKRCAALYGLVWLKSKGWTVDKLKANNYWWPRHFNCRSRVVPITKYSAELEKQRTIAANGDEPGQVSAKTDFQTFFDRQSVSFKREYLGDARYKLYEENRMKISQFVDIKSGREYTIAEIKERVS